MFLQFFPDAQCLEALGNKIRYGRETLEGSLLAQTSEKVKEEKVARDQRFSFREISRSKGLLFVKKNLKKHTHITCILNIGLYVLVVLAELA